MRQALKAQGMNERAAHSAAIQRKILGSETYRAARTICCFVSLPAEVSTIELIDEMLQGGKKVLVPLTNLENKEVELFEIQDRLKDLEPGTMGIPEPIRQRTRRAEPWEVDWVLVPGLAFTPDGRRLGRGAGLYDRFLKKLRPTTRKTGIGFSFQVVKDLPTEPHDVRLDELITNE